MKIDILECTLRDGSYLIDNQFTAKDIIIIASGLQNAGFKYIEIGHGLGLNASSSKGKAAETDEVYLKTARDVLSNSSFGMFLIPGIGRKDDLDLAAKYDMDFVRIGTNVTQVEESREYIEYAKDIGMYVSANLMKSYALPPDQFSEKALLAEKYGADVIALVDSAGGMLPDEVRKYIIAMKDVGISARLGFHGHNNLSLAVANTITAVQTGATIVDSTLQGIGRSAGNAPSEVLVAVLDKLGYETDIDLFKTMDLSDNIIKPLIKMSEGVDSIGLTSGFAQFHSSFLDNIYKASSKYAVDPRKLIISACEVDKVNLPDELAMRLAEDLYREKKALSDINQIDISSFLKIPRDRWNFNLSSAEKIRILATHLNNLSKKKGKQTILTINIPAKPVNTNTIYPSIFESSSYLMGNCEMADKQNILDTCKEVDGLIDFILIDGEKKNANLFTVLPEISQAISKTRVLTYKDNNTWVQGIDNFIACKYIDLYGKKVGMIGINDLSVRLGLSLADRGCKVFTYDGKNSDKIITSLNNIKIKASPFEVKYVRDTYDLSKDADILIGFSTESQINEAMLTEMKRDGIIIDAIIGSIDPKALNTARSLGISVWRIDMRPAMAGEITTVLRTYNMMKNIGRSTLKEIHIVSGGYIGNLGDVVVDSISCPTEVIGIADGNGRIMYDKEEEYSDLIKQVEIEIVKRMIYSQQKPEGTNNG